MDIAGFRIIFSLLLTVSLCIGAQPKRASDAPLYRVRDLGVLPGGSDSIAYAINNRNEVVGLSTITNGAFAPYSAFLFKAGNLVDIGAQFDVGGFEVSSAAVDINDSGLIAGYTYSDVTRIQTPFLLKKKNVFFNGGALDGHQINSIVAINDNGDFTGESESGAYLFDDRGFHALPLLGTNLELDVFGLNNSGEVAGWATDADFRAWAVVATAENIINLGAAPGASFSLASAINDSGHVVGNNSFLATEPNMTLGFLYKDGFMTNIGTLAGWQVCQPKAINEHDQIVGECFAEPSEVTGFVYLNGSMHDLNQSLVNADGFVIQRVSDINDRGVIVGTAARNGALRAVMLTPANSAARSKKQKSIRENEQIYLSFR